MYKSRIEADNHSKHGNVNVSGSYNNVVVNSKSTKIGNNEGKEHTHYLQIIYWIVGIIGVAFAIYFNYTK